MVHRHELSPEVAHNVHVMIAHNFIVGMSKCVKWESFIYQRKYYVT